MEALYLIGILILFLGTCTILWTLSILWTKFLIWILPKSLAEPLKRGLDFLNSMVKDK